MRLIRLILPPLLVAIASASPAEAQRLDAFGLRAGANVSRIASPFTGYGDRAGFQASAFGQLRFSTDLSLIAELEYAQRGYTLSATERDEASNWIGEATATTTLHYLSVPTLVRVSTSGPAGLEPYAIGGPRIEFLVARDPGYLAFTQGEVVDELAGAFNNFNTSIIMGLGVALRRAVGGQIFVEGRYSYGFIDQLRESDTTNVYLRGAELSLAYTF